MTNTHTDNDIEKFRKTINFYFSQASSLTISFPILVTLM